MYTYTVYIIQVCLYQLLTGVPIFAGLLKKENTVVVNGKNKIRRCTDTGRAIHPESKEGKSVNGIFITVFLDAEFPIIYNTLKGRSK